MEKARSERVLGPGLLVFRVGRRSHAASVDLKARGAAGKGDATREAAYGASRKRSGISTRCRHARSVWSAPSKRRVWSRGAVYPLARNAASALV